MKKVDKEVKCLREDCFLCKNIMPEWLDIVRIQRDVLAFNKGEAIFKEGQQVQGIYFILEGKVKIEMSWGEKSYIVRLATDGDILGHRGFGGDSIYPITGICLEATTVCFIPTNLFSTLLKTNANFLYELAFFYADELKRTERRMKNLAHMQVKGRVAESLLMIKNSFGTLDTGQLSFNLSRKEIASMAGTTYETVIRVLNELTREGYITLVDKNIIIRDSEALRKCCDKQLK